MAIDVLLIQSSFTPFLAENIYQSLRLYFKDPQGLGFGDDTRSVHFIPFPVVRQEYFDPVIERQVKRMQTVIELSRVIRDRRTLALKTPLKEVVVHHSSQEYLNDISSLSQYIEEELNVRQVVCTLDEQKCGVKWQLTADYAVLGRKLRKDLGKVKAALPNLSSEEAKEFSRSGKIQVAGVELVEGDLVASLSVDTPPQAEGGSDYESHTDGDVVVMMDCLVRPEYIDEALARELANKVQRARKEARLQATDDVDVYLRGDSPEAQEILERLLKGQAELVVRILKKLPKDARQLPEGTLPFWENEKDKPTEVGDQKVHITFVKL